MKGIRGKEKEEKKRGKNHLLAINEFKEFKTNLFMTKCW